MVRKSRNSEELRPRKLEGLFESISDEEESVGKKRKFSEEFEDISKMEVLLRIRPTPEDALPDCIHATGPNSIAISAPQGHMGTKNAEKSHVFAFSKVLQQDINNNQVFTRHLAKKVNSALYPAHESLVCFAYGITATGKTHSMEGNEVDPGIMPQTLQLLFQNKNEEETICLSMYEIYNESLNDMLNQKPSEGKSVSLKLKEDSSGNIWIPGLSQIEVDSVEDAKELLHSGLSFRKHAATGMNKRSSRSHSVVMINVINSVSKDWLSSISFVDLAGSERQVRTGNAGLRLKESVAINSSLMTLGRCLEALRWNYDHQTRRKKHIPFRQAKITHAFKNAFLGSGATVLLVNVSASAKDYEETVHVLKYASLAVTLPCSSRAPKALVNVGHASKKAKIGTDNGIKKSPLAKEDTECDSCHDEYYQQVEQEMQRLRSELFESERRAVEMEARIREEVANEMSDLLREMENAYHTRLESEVSAAQAAACNKPSTIGSPSEEEDENEEIIKRLEIELEKATEDILSLKEESKQNEQKLLDRFDALLKEEQTQWRANAAMEKETLEVQLDRQRHENESTKERLKRMKEAMVAALRRYSGAISPGILALISPDDEDSENLMLNDCIPKKEDSIDRMQCNDEDIVHQEETRRPSFNDAYDVKMDNFVVKSIESAPSNDENKHPKPKAAKKKKKAKRSKGDGTELVGDERVESKVSATPLARRTRAGRRACKAIDNVH